jgi:hypothetical protein
MTDAELNHFRAIAAAMQDSPADWQWIGKHLSQRLFDITEQRARDYARRFGGEAKRMPMTPEPDAGRRRF